MEKQEINMPRMGAFSEQGQILEWMVKEGEHVEEGQALARINVEKMETELESLYDGTVVEISGVVGDTYPVGAVLGYIEEDE